MSILIKGVDMPKAGGWKTIRIYYDGTCAEPNWQGDCEYMRGCEAVPVPPHGRLIDADSMEKEVCGGCVHGEHKYANCIDCALANAPTVIPAEKMKEET